MELYIYFHANEGEIRLVAKQCFASFVPGLQVYITFTAGESAGCLFTHCLLTSNTSSALSPTNKTQAPQCGVSLS